MTACATKADNCASVNTIIACISVHKTLSVGYAPSPHNPCAGILEQSKGTRNQVGIKLSYRPARLHRLAVLILGMDSWAH